MVRRQGAADIGATRSRGFARFSGPLAVEKPLDSCVQRAAAKWVHRRRCLRLSTSRHRTGTLGVQKGEMMFDDKW